MGDITYKKEYLPGYTGHVPKKNDIYGCTTGDINRIITGQAYKPSNFDIDVAPIQATQQPPYAQRTFYSKPPTQDQSNQRLQFGNLSKYGQNWIGGPTHNVKAQHVPGYQGYIPGLKAENLYGKSFARTTSQAINKEHTIGVEIPVNERFKTTNGSEINKQNFRRIKNDIEPADRNDLRETDNFQDAE